LNLDRQLIALSIFHIINDGSLAVFLAALPVMHVALNLSLIEIGTILSAGLISTVVMQVVFGFLSDRGFAPYLLLGGLIALAVVDILFVSATAYWNVLVIYLLLRAAAGVYHPVAFSTVFRTARNRSAAMGFQSGFGDSSIAFAMLTTGFLAESLGWEMPFLLWGFAGFAATLAFILLGGYSRRNTYLGDNPESLEVQNQGITKRYILLQLLALFIQCLYLIFSSFMPLFLNVNVHLSPGVSSFLVALWIAIGVAFSFNTGRFVKLLGDEHRTLRVCFGLTALMFLAATVLVLRSEMWTFAIAIVVLSGVPFFLSFPVLYGIIGTAAPANRLGLAYATNLSVSLIGGSFFSYGGGYLSSIYSLTALFPILAVLAVSAFINMLAL
jgi:predicted MFS family arabinose efflux permease